MEYIPDGLTRSEWDAIKKKEQEEQKNKGNMAILGTKRFKSRSFEAWQKAGAKHLFPVDPKTAKYEERPYMQRKGGDWEGKDLIEKGLFGFGQGAPSERLVVDDIYEKAKKEGKLNSASIFGGANLPWTNEAANAISSSNSKPVVKPGQEGKAGKQLSPEELEKLKKTLFKPVVSSKSSSAPSSSTTEPPKKKGFFGLF